MLFRANWQITGLTKARPIAPGQIVDGDLYDPAIAPNVAKIYGGTQSETARAALTPCDAAGKTIDLASYVLPTKQT